MSGVLGVSMFSELILLLALSAAPPPPAAPPRPVIERPDWIQKPDGDDVNYHYPARASRENVGGRVVLRCLVQETGYVTDCKVVEETPVGYEFGAAGLGLSTKFRMRPMSADGMPVRGATVMIPLRFQPAEEDAGEPPMLGSELPDLETGLKCYGHFAALGEKEPANAEARANAAIYLLPVAIGGFQAGWSPSKTEAALIEARKAGDPAKRPDDCEAFLGAGERLGDL